MSFPTQSLTYAQVDSKVPAVYSITTHAIWKIQGERNENSPTQTDQKQSVLGEPDLVLPLTQTQPA